MSIFNVAFTFVACLFSIIGALESTTYFWYLLPFSVVGFCMATVQVFFAVYDFITSPKSKWKRLLWGFKHHFMGENFELSQSKLKSIEDGGSIYCNPFYNKTTFCFHNEIIKTTNEERFELIYFMEATNEKHKSAMCGFVDILLPFLVCSPPLRVWSASVIKMMAVTYKKVSNINGHNGTLLNDTYVCNEVLDLMKALITQMNVFNYTDKRFSAYKKIPCIRKESACYNFLLKCKSVHCNSPKSNDADDFVLETLGFDRLEGEEGDYRHLTTDAYKDLNKIENRLTLFEEYLNMVGGESNGELVLDFANCRLNLYHNVNAQDYQMIFEAYVDGLKVCTKKFSEKNTGTESDENKRLSTLRGLCLLKFICNAVYKDNRTCCFVSDGWCKMKTTFIKKELFFTNHCYNFPELLRFLFDDKLSIKYVPRMRGVINIFEGFIKDKTSDFAASVSKQKEKLLQEKLGENNLELLNVFFSRHAETNEKKNVIVDLLCKNLNFSFLNNTLKKVGYSNWQWKRNLVDLSYFMELAGSTALKGVDIKMNPRTSTLNLFKGKVQSIKDLPPMSVKNCLQIQVFKKYMDIVKPDDPIKIKEVDVLKGVDESDDKFLERPVHSICELVRRKNIFKYHNINAGNIGRSQFDKSNPKDYKGDNKYKSALGRGWDLFRLPTSTNFFTNGNNRGLSYVEVVKKSSIKFAKTKEKVSAICKNEIESCTKPGECLDFLMASNSKMNEPYLPKKKEVLNTFSNERCITQKHGRKRRGKKGKMGGKIDKPGFHKVGDIKDVEKVKVKRFKDTKMYVLKNEISVKNYYDVLERTNEEHCSDSVSTLSDLTLHAVSNRIKRNFLSVFSKSKIKKCAFMQIMKENDKEVKRVEENKMVEKPVIIEKVIAQEIDNNKEHLITQTKGKTLSKEEGDEECQMSKSEADKLEKERRREAAQKKRDALLETKREESRIDSSRQEERVRRIEELERKEELKREAYLKKLKLARALKKKQKEEAEKGDNVQK